MPNTPAKKHFERTTAEQQNKEVAEHGRTRANASLYELQLLKIAQHRGELRAIKSQEKKAERKRDFIDTYRDYIDGVIASDTGTEDEVVMTVFVWMIDAGMIVDAVRLAEYALKHNLPMPDKFRRDCATVLAEEIADHVLRSKNDFPDVALLLQVKTLTDERDMHDQVRAKLFKAIGVAFDALGNFAEAGNYYRRALELDPKGSGVKKMIERADREAEKAGQLAR
ncbi:MAG: phage terminase small subunit [Gammaproteobacteria bacterium]|nr:phage terminase small subunit [Gammaproteobacteria bacterium]